MAISNEYEWNIYWCPQITNNGWDPNAINKIPSTRETTKYHRGGHRR